MPGTPAEEVHMQLSVMSAFLGRDKNQVPALIACAQQAGANVLCVQELMSSEIAHLKETYSNVQYVAMTEFEDGRTMGMAICSNLPMLRMPDEYYAGNENTVLRFDESTPQRVNATKRRPLVVCQVFKDSKLWYVGNTHFLYIKGGVVEDEHRMGLRILRDLIQRREELILCGAMVMARDGELYRELMHSKLEDWVPREITCTLDRTLHKLAPQLEKGEMPPVVVDYIFAKGGYTPLKVRQFEGVCDHTPLLATARQ